MRKNCSVYFELPKDFISPVEASVCFCECNNRILLLKRHPQKWGGNAWNIPGGKIDPGESPVSACLRETYEEAGVQLVEESIEHMKTLYVRTDNRDNIWYVFRSRLDTAPKIYLREEEAIEFAWKTLAEAFALPLIMGGKEALEAYKNHLKTPSCGCQKFSNH